jgi:hypothetical protein
MTPSGTTPGYLMREVSQGLINTLSRPGSINPHQASRRETDNLSDSDDDI